MTLLDVVNNMFVYGPCLNNMFVYGPCLNNMFVYGPCLDNLYHIDSFLLGTMGGIICF